ncbi:dolichol phosphate-mannose biosynthesis regulatory [Absidia repens]|uniref:Dolichol phosphate-mannose biosynthesis regulatory protein n=1 Tax=Absidia repens TaxID=90262 RepID=A0A1X2IMF6_9FUNG|nr:dolichol phosphate-mannose biosynthesis regulatory [Absidia repens]
MSTGADKVVGAGAYASAWIIFIYYTLWALVMPLLDEDNALQQYFPPFEYAIRLPFFTLLFGVAGIVAVFAYASAKQKAKQTKKST